MATVVQDLTLAILLGRPKERAMRPELVWRAPFGDG
jgi:hypothetical protein